MQNKKNLPQPSRPHTSLGYSSIETRCLPEVERKAHRWSSPARPNEQVYTVAALLLGYAKWSHNSMGKHCKSMKVGLESLTLWETALQHKIYQHVLLPMVLSDPADDPSCQGWIKLDVGKLAPKNREKCLSIKWKKM